MAEVAIVQLSATVVFGNPPQPKTISDSLRSSVPPGRPVIYNERGIIVETNLGPYNEGVELILTCSVSGGRSSSQTFQYCIDRRIGPRFSKMMLL